MMQHSTLAVLPDGRVLGVLDQCWFNRVNAPEAETRLERERRWRESDVWPDSVRRVSQASQGTRFVHVMDRAGDSLVV